jgi:hypothetical protein
MDAPTVKELLGDIPAMHFEWNPHDMPDPSKIWANFDKDSDSFILYTIGKPKSGVKVWVGDDIYVIVDRVSRKAIGLYVENWERNFVPAHEEIRVLWEGLNPNPIPLETAWISLLRMMALWIILSLRAEGEGYSANLQPA